MVLAQRTERSVVSYVVDFVGVGDISGVRNK